MENNSSARNVPTDDLATLISAVLNHPETPPGVYEGIANGMNSVFNDLGNNKAVTDTAEYIRLVLDQYHREDAPAQAETA